MLKETWWFRKQSFFCEVLGGVFFFISLLLLRLMFATSKHFFPSHTSSDRRLSQRYTHHLYKIRDVN